MDAIVKMEEVTGKKFGDKRKSTSCICSFWSKSFYARYDGYNLKPRLNEEVVKVLAEKSGNPSLGMGLLQKIYPDVF